MLPIPVLSLTCVAVLLTVMGWWRSQRVDGASMLVWWQRTILWSCLVSLLVLRWAVDLSFAVLLLGLGGALLIYGWLGYRYRRQVGQTVELRPVPPPSMAKDDLLKLQGVFSIDSFYATSIANYQDGAIVRGNLRAEAEVCYGMVRSALERILGTGYQLFMLEGQDRRPLLLILPERALSPLSWWQWAMCAALLVLCGWAGWVVGYQFALGMVLVLAGRELTLRWIARRHGVVVGLPFALPSLQLGCFGLFSRFRTPLPNRQVLWELASFPALVGGGISLILLMAGLGLSGMGYGTIELPSQVFQASALVGTLARLVMGTALHVSFVNVHPLVLMGWVGLGVTALNLIPAGQLDGGRLVQAIYGRRTASWATVLSLLCLAVVSLVNPIALYWGAIILIVLRDQEAPMFNELTETTHEQDALGIVLLFAMLTILLPLTPAVAEFWQIGA